MKEELLFLKHTDLFKKDEELTKSQLVELLRLIYVIDYNRVVDHLQTMFDTKGYMITSNLYDDRRLDMLNKHDIDIYELMKYLFKIADDNGQVDILREEMSLFLNEPKTIDKCLSLLYQYGIIDEEYNGKEIKINSNMYLRD